MSGPVREYTKYFDFEIPSFDFPGWHVFYDRNVKTIDTILYLMTGTDSLKGIWKNNEHYLVGDRVVDIQVSFAYECFVEHTSAAAPTTFAQDRANHPNYWHPIDFIQALSGTSPTNVAIGLGNKTFATQTGRIFNPGARIIASSAANPTVDYMWGVVVSYTGNTLVMRSDVFGGSGTHGDWLISVSGERGPQGIQGPIGIQGIQGEQGIQGIQGIQGPQGIIEEAPADGGIYGRKGDNHSWTVVTATNAASLPYTPHGDLQSTNMQAAINELEDEKLSKSLGGTITGPVNLTGGGHHGYAAPGAGSWYSTSTTVDRFFVGTGTGTDTFRIFTNAMGDAFSVDGASGRITIVHPPTAANHIATKAYVDGLTASVVDTTGDVMTGNLYVPGLGIYNPTSVSDIWFTRGTAGNPLANPRWLLRCEPDPSGDINYHHYNDTGGYLGSIMTLSRNTHDVTFQQDIIVNRNVRTSGSLALGLNVATGYSGDGANILIRAYGAGDIYMSYGSGAAHYARFGYGGSRIFGSLDIDGQANAGTLNAYGNVWTQGGVLYMSPQGHYMQWNGSSYQFPHGHLYSPAGRLYGTNDFNPASFTVQGGLGQFSVIEGPYYIDMFYPGHGGDYNARLIVQADHHLDIEASWTSISGGLNTGNINASGPIVCASTLTINVGNHLINNDNYRCKYTGNGWHFNWEGTLVAYLDNNSWGSVLNVHSDYRMKKDIANLGIMWNKVKALRPVKFTQTDWAPYAENDNVERWGFLAHELQATLIESAATGTKDCTGAPQQPYWTTILAAVTKALQEAMTRIEALEAKP